MKCYYLVTGSNGVIIKETYLQAYHCRMYLRQNRIKKYQSFEEAETAALEHLQNITPYYIPIPDSVQLNQMITVSGLRKTAAGSTEV